VSAVTQDAETTLAWEARHRPRAAIAAFIAAIGLLAFNVAQQVLAGDMPSTSGLEALMRAVQPGPVAEQPSLQIPVFEYIDSKSGLSYVQMLGGLLGFVGTGWAVGFLAVATRARLPHLRRFMIYAPIVGGVLLGVSAVASQIGQRQVISEVLDGPRTVAAVTDISNSLIQVAQLLLLLGTFALAVGLVLVSLNAMRSGLLTRMLGYLGIAAGALTVIISGGMPIVQIFWLAALGFLLLGRWPGGAPPAWRTGQAEPWPTPEPRQRAPRPAPEGPSLEKTPAAGARRKRKKRN
jgi:hypothetical protein